MLSIYSVFGPEIYGRIRVRSQSDSACSRADFLPAARMHGSEGRGWLAGPRARTSQRQRRSPTSSPFVALLPQPWSRPPTVTRFPFCACHTHASCDCDYDRDCAHTLFGTVDQRVAAAHTQLRHGDAHAFRTPVHTTRDRGWDEPTI